MTGEAKPLTGIRKAMASAMARSWSEIPHFAQIVEIDAVPLLAQLEKVRAAVPEGAPRVSINDILVHAAAQALAQDPALNVLFHDGKVTTQQGAAIAVAVATDHGLMTPVLQGADSHDIYSLSAALRTQAEKARAWRLKPEEFEGAVLTVSNLGAFNIDTGFPVINQRQTALLFMGSVKKRPFVIGDQVVARETAYLTLSCDHRVIDGVTAARFLARVCAGLNTEAA